MVFKIPIQANTTLPNCIESYPAYFSYNKIRKFDNFFVLKDYPRLSESDLIFSYSGILLMSMSPVGYLLFHYIECNHKSNGCLPCQQSADFPPLCESL